VTTTKRALACGDYAIELDGAVVASVERKSLTDLVSSLINGTLRYALGELATLPRAAVVVEDRYTQALRTARPGRRRSRRAAGRRLHRHPPRIEPARRRSAERGPRGRHHRRGTPTGIR